MDGNVTVIKRDIIGYNGKLTMQTLYPQNPVTKVIDADKLDYLIRDADITGFDTVNSHKIEKRNKLLSAINLVF